MFDLSIKNNLKKFGLKAKEFKALTPKAVRSAFYDIGKDLVHDTKKYIDETKHGRIYLTRIGKSKFRKAGITPNKKNKNRKHIASAAGEAPAILTGRLKKSVDFNVIGAERMEFGVNKQRWGCDYAKYLEYKNLIAMTGQVSKKIAPRPFISRSYHDNKVKLINRIRQAVKQSLAK